MSNGHVCCILGVCCPPGSQEQRRALAGEIQNHIDDEVAAERQVSAGAMAADYVLAHFDLVPKGVGSTIVEHYGPEFAHLPPPKPGG